ncbi:MAG: dihydroorotate dehydrogenase electron transfer subunit [Desulfobacteraceae bacterium]|nr:MAG: dihydroorotate dehydrogenase electron transfer subunit [Desulfobacteraceae bacterium]
MTEGKITDLAVYDNKMLEETVLIEFNRQIGKDTWLMGFRSADLASLAKPGQFLMIHLDRNTKDPLLRRPFSIHRIQDRNQLMILYKIVGKGTLLLSSLKEGDPISVIGPLGNGFTISGPHERTLLIAGGMGIAPLFFLAQALNKVQKHTIKMFLGFSTSQEVVLVDQLKGLNIDLSLTTEDGSLGIKGLVTDLLDEYLRQELNKKPVIYACGPTLMLKKVAQMAITSNLRCYVSLEGYMACGLGICQGCAVKAGNSKDKPYYYVCQDGPVFSSEMIDWRAM